MFKALLGSTAVFVILGFAVIAPAGLVQAQQAGQAPAAAEPAPAQPAATEPAAGAPAAAAPGSNDGELSDDEIRQILAKESTERFEQWKRRRGHLNAKDCSDYNGVDGPAKPADVFCDPAEVPVEQIDLYRQSQAQQGTSFVNEPRIKF